MDDDLVIRHAIRAALSQSGFRVTVVPSAAEALEVMSQSLPDVVVLDTVMPGVDGLTFLEILRESPLTRDLPVILISSKDTTEDVVRGLLLGADDYVSTPVDLAELVARVRAKVMRPPVSAEELPRHRRIGLLTDKAFHRALNLEIRRVDLGAPSGCVARIGLAELANLRDGLTTPALDEISLQLASLVSTEALPLELLTRQADGSMTLLLPESTADDARARLYDFSQRMMQTTFKVQGRLLRFTPVVGIAVLEPGVHTDQVMREAAVAMQHASLQLDLQPSVYAPGQEKEVSHTRSSQAAGHGKWRLPLQITLAVAGLFAPSYAAYSWFGSLGIDFTMPAYILVVIALFFTSLMIVWEGMLALRRVDPPEAAEPCPPASAVIAAYLPNEAATIISTIDAFLKLDYPDLQIVLAYNTPRDLPIEAELKRIAERHPRFVPLRVPHSTSKAQNVNAALSVVRGEFVGLFDADHHPDPDSFRRAWRWLSNGYDVVQGRCVIRNGEESWVARTVAVEFERMYAISHPGRTRLHGFGIFGGSNGYWNTALLRQTRMHAFMLTEDIDSTMRVLENGFRIATDPWLVSRELGPATVRALWNQRMRWAQGWFQVSLKRLWRGLRSPNLSAQQKLGLTYLLGWREVYPWVSMQVFPILAYWYMQGRPINWFIAIFVFTTVFTLSSGPLTTLFAYRVADPQIKRHKSWFLAEPFVSLVFFTEFKNLVSRVAQIKEASGERVWRVTPRTGYLENSEGVSKPL